MIIAQEILTHVVCPLYKLTPDGNYDIEKNIN